MTRFEPSATARRRENLAAAGGTATLMGAGLALAGTPLLAAAGVAAGAGTLVYGVWQLRARRAAVRAVEVDDAGILLELAGGVRRVPWAEVRSVRFEGGYRNREWVIATDAARHRVLAAGMTSGDVDTLCDLFAQHGF